VKARIEALEAQIESLHDELRMMSMRSAGVLPRGKAAPDHYEDVPDFAHLKKSQRAYVEPVVTQVAPRAPVPGPAVRPAPTVTPPVAAPSVAPARERLTPAPVPRNVRRAEPRLD
jgi:hypothetical protein